MREIPLTKGKVAIVDDADYEWLNQWKWNAGDGKYAVRTDGFGGPTIFMHRLILNPPDDMDTDHVNGNKLDNRRENLGACSRSQNVANVGLRSTNISGFKGVHLRTTHRGNRNWTANIGVNGKREHLGYFDNPTDAAVAYNNAATKYFGEFAKLNEVSP